MCKVGDNSCLFTLLWSIIRSYCAINPQKRVCEYVISLESIEAMLPLPFFVCTIVLMDLRHLQINFIAFKNIRNHITTNYLYSCAHISFYMLEVFLLCGLLYRTLYYVMCHAEKIRTIKLAHNFQKRKIHEYRYN